MTPPDSALQPGIEKTPGICGGEARIVGTRIPVWLLVGYRDEGLSETDLLKNFPTLTSASLANAWDYAAAHSLEISAAILANSDEGANGSPLRK